MLFLKTGVQNSLTGFCMTVIYGFGDTVPAGIWDGRLEVDFNLVSEETAYLYEN